MAAAAFLSSRDWDFSGPAHPGPRLYDRPASSAGEFHVASPPSGKITLAGLFLSALVGVFLGVSLYSFDYAEGASYLSSDPGACANCHIMRDELDSWQKSPHHAVAVCNDCHVPQNFVGKYATKVEHGYRHSKGFTFQDFHEPIQITPKDLKIVERNCLRCHS